VGATLPAGAGVDGRRQCGARVGRIATAAVGRSGHNAAMTLQRIAWTVTVVALLVGALIMLLSHYQGYAALFAAVALSAAINLR
jgi:hypothetical protein